MKVGPNLTIIRKRRDPETNTQARSHTLSEAEIGVMGL